MSNVLHKQQLCGNINLQDGVSHGKQTFKLNEHKVEPFELPFDIWVVL